MKIQSCEPSIFLLILFLLGRILIFMPVLIGRLLVGER